MNLKAITITLLFFLILCVAATWGKFKEWFWSISTNNQFVFILVSYSFLCLVLYQFNPEYPLYFFFFTVFVVVMTLLFYVFKFLKWLIDG